MVIQSPGPVKAVSFPFSEDNTCYRTKDFISFILFALDLLQPTTSLLSLAIARLEACLQDLKTWLASNGLKLNDDKSEFLLQGFKHMLGKIDTQSCLVHIGSTSIAPSKTARNLGVVFDQEMSFCYHITRVQQNVRC